MQIEVPPSWNHCYCQGFHEGGTLICIVLFTIIHSNLAFFLNIWSYSDKLRKIFTQADSGLSSDIFLHRLYSWLAELVSKTAILENRARSATISHLRTSWEKTSKSHRLRFGDNVSWFCDISGWTLCDPHMGQCHRSWKGVNPMWFLMRGFVIFWRTPWTTIIGKTFLHFNEKFWIDVVIVLDGLPWMFTKKEEKTVASICSTTLL